MRLALQYNKPPLTSIPAKSVVLEKWRDLAREPPRLSKDITAANTAASGLNPLRVWVFYQLIPAKNDDDKVAEGQ